MYGSQDKCAPLVRGASEDKQEMASQTGVPLIAGLECGMKQWTGMNNGLE